MGRVKLKIKRLESSSNRQITYSKRRNGILKKAKELSILCDVDILLLMFSPTEKPTIFHGKHSLEEIITKFAQLSPQERAKRKLESLEGLRKTFKKLDHDVNIQDFLGVSNPTIEELGNHVRLLQCHLTEVHRRLRCWCDMDVTTDLELLTQMEDTLRESLNQIHVCKENYRQHQHKSLEYKSEHALQYPSMLFGMQEAQPLSWHPYSENQHMQNFLFSEDPNFFSQREVECASNVSFPSHSGYCMGTTSEQAEVDTRGHISNVVYEEAVPQEYTNSVFLNEQYPYHPYASNSAVAMFTDNSFPQRPN